MRELKTWIDAAKKKLHDNVLGIALANKLARKESEQGDGPSHLDRGSQVRNGLSLAKHKGVIARRRLKAVRSKTAYCVRILVLCVKF
jgi:hypothetical protein